MSFQDPLQLIFTGDILTSTQPGQKVSTCRETSSQWTAYFSPTEVLWPPRQTRAVVGGKDDGAFEESPIIVLRPAGETSTQTVQNCPYV